jgi:GTP pyrophosphokinase
MRTLEHLKPEKQQRIARETLDVYAPLAHRLGMGKLRGELEDLAFRYTDPFTYTQLSTEVDGLRAEGKAFLDNIVDTLEAKLKESNISARVEARIKRLYSIQQKLTKHAIPIEQVFDLFAVRVITATEQDCYAALGLLHSTWRPVPGRFKDFIAMPRPNLYQSLHTTLIAEGGHQFEVQIRTEEMHKVAEEGIAAHWKYKATDNVSAKDEQRLAWVRQLMEWQRDVHPESGSVPRGGLLLHSQGQGHRPSQGRQPRRLRLRHPHRCRPRHHRRQGQRSHRPAPPQAP